MQRYVRSTRGSWWGTACALLVLSGCSGADSAEPRVTLDDAALAQDAMLGEADTATIQLRYTCNNQFLITNAAASAVAIEYGVTGATRTAVTLPQGPGGDPGFSETLVDVPGSVYKTVTVVRSGKVVAQHKNLGDACAAPGAARYSVGGVGGAAMGEWSPGFRWPIVAVHMSLLPDGRVLSWDRTNDPPSLWNPITGEFGSAASPSLLFCSGHTFLGDGTLFVTGGHVLDKKGLPNSNIFNSATASWTAGSPMQYARWYPTATAMANGDVVTVGGTDQNAVNVIYPEVWSNGSWRTLTAAPWPVPYYPRAFLSPNGKLFYAGETNRTRYLDPIGGGLWSATVAYRVTSNRSYAPAVMYQPGKIVYIGGGAPTPTTETIDLKAAKPVWRFGASMAFPRRHHNATLLADGRVLVSGGSYGSSFSDQTKPVYATELWDPASGTWTTLASATVVRVYHSTVVLLPNATVLSAGGGSGSGTTNQYMAEIFTPPYLFNADGTRATQPTISAAPAAIGFGERFSVETPNVDDIVSVTWLRLGSTTHAFNTTQNFQTLSFTVRADTTVVPGGPPVDSIPPDSTIAPVDSLIVHRRLEVQMTADPTAAPAGPYMLFVINRQGTPSVARMMSLH